jgi:hypothetical protein
MRKTIAGVAALGIAGTMALSGCGTGHAAYANSTYCVDNGGHVLPDTYCTPGGVGYNPLFFYMLGTFHGHSYHSGMVIPRSYMSHSRKVIPTDRAARARAGLPSSGSVRSGYTPRTSSSTPAKPGTSPKAPSTSKSGSITSRIGSGFKSTFGGGSSGRSTFGGGGSRSFGGGRR